MTVDAGLSHASRRLAAADIAEPRREAASLLAFALDRPAAFLIAHPEYQLTDIEWSTFDSAVARRETREPFQYITRRQEFWGLDFIVAPGVLIPRPETEILVAAVIEHLQTSHNPRFVEVGIGSGCISISVLHSIPTATAVATDLSSAAIDMATQNASRHGVGERLELRQGNLLTGVDEGPDLIVSNPPYIPDPDIENLQAEVRDFEPHTALAGGPDGLDVIRRLIVESSHILHSGGVLLIEIGADQAAAVADLLNTPDWATPEFRKDLQAIPRVVTVGRR
ncbi:MAG: peptide chain release factor N(5)-glutamine methyltransferase [Pyrinomonadaceae bacterium]